MDSQKFIAASFAILFTICIITTGVTVNGVDLPGHLLPLGSHRPAIQVDVRDSTLDPIDFFDNYVKPSKPVLLKGAAKTFPSFMLWNDDDYLKKTHGDWKVYAEKGKKETRKGEQLSMSFRSFLNVYNKTDIYLVHDILPNSTMADDVYLPKCLLCGGFAESVVTSVMWFSSGGTKSVLHNDDLDNINCLYAGKKDLVMIDKKHEELIPIDHPEGGYSSVDVEKVNMTRYPTLSQVPWYEAKMEAGDCFYIPYKWYHHVSSSQTRNLAINIWFSYLTRLSAREDCLNQLSSLPNHRLLSTVFLVNEDVQLRTKFFEFFETSEELTFKQMVALIPEAKNLPESLLKKLSRFFKEWDKNHDEVFTFSEAESLSKEQITRFFDFINAEENGALFADSREPELDAPAGHLQPLGSHMPPLSIEVRTSWPDPMEFHENYAMPGKPVLFQGAAKEFPSFRNFQDDSYLKREHGSWQIEAEEGKKENRSKDVFQMTFAKFLDTYQQSDIYMVEDIKPTSKLADDVFLPKSLLCGGFTDMINTAIMWFSSGSTKSVLHNDGFDNLNCLYDGTKQLVIIDKKHKSLVPIDVPEGGYSNVDVEKVDMYKYPTLQAVPWYNVTMQAGDCLFIPMEWYHQVNSLPSRNLAINVWWSHLYDRQDTCPNDLNELPAYSPLSGYKFAPITEVLRASFLRLFDGSKGTATLEQLKTATMSSKDALAKFFGGADKNQDGVLTYKEVYELPPNAFAAFQEGQAGGITGEEGEEVKRKDEL